jgi:hypothetical protein
MSRSDADHNAPAAVPVDRSSLPDGAHRAPSGASPGASLAWVVTADGLRHVSGTRTSRRGRGRQRSVPRATNASG